MKISNNFVRNSSVQSPIEIYVKHWTIFFNRQKKNASASELCYASVSMTRKEDKNSALVSCFL